MSRYPLLEELWIWNDNQTGTLAPTSTVLRSVQAFDNHYTAADFSGLFPSGRAAEVNVNGNELTSLSISDSPGLMFLYAKDNNLGQMAVDDTIEIMVSYGTSGGVLDLSGNSAPSEGGLVFASILESRGWTVTLEAGQNSSEIEIGSRYISVSSTSAAIFWDTTQPGTSAVFYGSDYDLSDEVSSEIMTNNHFMLIEGLNPDTTYIFRIFSEDTNGNTSSAIGTLKTRTEGNVYWEDDFHRADGPVGNNWEASNNATAVVSDEILQRTDENQYRILFNMTETELPADYFVTIFVPETTVGRNFWGLIGRYDENEGTGNKIFWTNVGSENAGVGHASIDNDLSLTVTGGYPENWTGSGIHAVTLGYSGNRVTVYLDGEELGYFNDATNNQTGTGIGLVGEGNGGSFNVLDVRVTDFLPDFSFAEDDASPVITAFEIPETSQSLTVPIESFEVDDFLVTGYMITETPEAPDFFGSGWSEEIPHQYVFQSEGLKTLYAWAKDGNNLIGGSLSESVSDSVLISTEDPNDDIDKDDDEPHKPEKLDISKVKYKIVADNQIQIKFKTNNKSKGIIKYGTDPRNLNKKKTEDKNHQDHSISIKGLNPGTKYYFRIQAKDVYNQSDSRRINQLFLPELKKIQPRDFSLLKSAGKNFQKKEIDNKEDNDSQGREYSEKLNSENQENRSQTPQEQIQKFEERQTSQKKSFVWWNPSTWF
ncbi:MAG: hypothetical protein HGA61_02240 [Candidatus Moranbacteria bacterium]|nr:hypothetical protein [Candidatus Moranbacteria bacterium]